MRSGLGFGLGLGLGSGYGVRAPSYAHNYVHFDGVNDWLYRTNALLTGLTNGTSLTVAFAVDTATVPESPDGLVVYSSFQQGSNHFQG